MALHRSNITENYMVFGPIPSYRITWRKPITSTTVNTLIINKLHIKDIQDQLLYVTSAEDYSTPSSRDKLLKLNKERALKNIMDNTSVDLINNKSSVNILYKPNLADLGENLAGATARVHTLHKKIYNLPEVPAEMDKYVQQQVHQGNYVKINPEDFKDKYQLPYVA